MSFETDRNRFEHARDVAHVGREIKKLEEEDGYSLMPPPKSLIDKNIEMMEMIEEVELELLTESKFLDWVNRGKRDD